MISFTVKGKNFHPRAKYWIPIVYYYENGDMKYIVPVGWNGIKRALITETVSFSETPINVGFNVRMEDAANEGIYEPYAYAGTTPFPLKDGGRYSLDFHSEVGLVTLLEEEEVLPEFLKWLIPWSPLFGPPVPKLLPPWPWWFSRWEEAREESLKYSKGREEILR